MLRIRDASRTGRSVMPRTVAKKVCVECSCCETPGSPSPCTATVDCRDCLPCTSSSPLHTSKCLDTDHISSACTELDCSAATASTTPTCSGAALPCCDSPDCIDSPMSACNEETCETLSPCSLTVAACCTTLGCESETDSMSPSVNVCDGIIVGDAICDAYHGTQDKCPDCRGLVSQEQHPQHGRVYTSFQELLDCCCCSMPSAADQCCIDGMGHNEGARRPHTSEMQPTHLSCTPSSVTGSSSFSNTDMHRSRSSTVSLTVTPPDVPSPIHSLSKISQRPQESDNVSSVTLLDDAISALQSWDDCSFVHPHSHDNQGMCLPPPSFCEFSSCETTAPHSHWASASLVSEQDERCQFCQWAGCQERFWTVEELVAHVNHAHLATRKLMPDATAEPASGLPYQLTAHGSDLSDVMTPSISCLWKDCQQVPPSVHLDQATAAKQADTWIAESQLLNDRLSLAMLQHLMHDHLNKTDVAFENGVRTSDMSARYEGSTTDVAVKRRRCDSCSEGEAGEDTLRCRWEGCSQTFANHSQLTDHISRVHVGSGKNEYECRWAGCERHAEGKKFSQKQKVLRHIQTHTGDRPFKCHLCGKRFSEPNTLAQHVRTHTQEKPYVCDFPGCGKSFAVAGSLTIHKRIHSGAKPFVCKFPGCDKAFAESSNLNKHIRTHTGQKPFGCSECGKGFSRPDQLSRHRRSHERKLPPALSKITI